MTHLPPGYKEDDPLERDIQKDVVTHARGLGWKCNKWRSESNRSAPDYLLFYKKSRFRLFLIIEFKRLGKKPTPKQKGFHDELFDGGFNTFTIDTVEKGKQLVRIHTPRGWDDLRER